MGSLCSSEQILQQPSTDFLLVPMKRSGISPPCPTYQLCRFSSTKENHPKMPSWDHQKELISWNSLGRLFAWHHYIILRHFSGEGFWDPRIAFPTQKKNPPKIRKTFIWSSFSEQFPLGSWLVSQGRRQNFVWIFRTSSCKRAVFLWYFGIWGGFLGLSNQKFR